MRLVAVLALSLSCVAMQSRPAKPILYPAPRELTPRRLKGLTRPELLIDDEGGRLFGVTEQGDLAAFDVATGKPLWVSAHATGEDYRAPLLALADRVLVLVARFTGLQVVGLRLRDGAQLWRSAVIPLPRWAETRRGRGNGFAFNAKLDDGAVTLCLTAWTSWSGGHAPDDAQRAEASHDAAGSVRVRPYDGTVTVGPPCKEPKSVAMPPALIEFLESNDHWLCHPLIEWEGRYFTAAVRRGSEGGTFSWFAFATRSAIERLPRPELDRGNAKMIPGGRYLVQAATRHELRSVATDAVVGTFPLALPEGIRAEPRDEYDRVRDRLVTATRVGETVLSVWRVDSHNVSPMRVVAYTPEGNLRWSRTFLDFGSIGPGRP